VFNVSYQSHYPNPHLSLKERRWRDFDSVHFATAGETSSRWNPHASRRVVEEAWRRPFLPIRGRVRRQDAMLGRFGRIAYFLAQLGNPQTLIRAHLLVDVVMR